MSGVGLPELRRHCTLSLQNRSGFSASRVCGPLRAGVSSRVTLPVRQLVCQQLEEAHHRLCQGGGEDGRV